MLYPHEKEASTGNYVKRMLGWTLSLKTIPLNFLNL